MNARSSFDDFFRADYPLLFAYLRKCGFDRQTAEDAAAEAMTQAFQVWDSIASPGAWVRKAASRIALAQARRDRESVERAAGSDWAHGGRCAQDPRMASVEEEPIIVELLGQLPERQRHVMACDLEGMKAQEIAEHLGMSWVTVRSNLRHARRRLRQLYLTDYRKPPETED